MELVPHLTILYLYHLSLIDYVTTSGTVQKINWSMEFFSRHQDSIQDTAVDEIGIPLDYTLLIGDHVLQNAWPHIADDMYNFPSNTLAVLSLAMYEVFSNFFYETTSSVLFKEKQINFQVLNTIKSKEKCETHGAFTQNSKVTIHIPYVRARLINYRKATRLKNIRANLFGKLVTVNGTVVRASNEKCMCLAMAFECRTCSGVWTYPQTDGTYELPPRCILDRDELQCTGNNFEPMRGSSRNVIVECQSIRIQENSSENLVDINYVYLTSEC